MFPSEARAPIACMCACKKVPILHIFNTPFLPTAHARSLGCQTLRRLGTCRVLSKCGQLMLVLRQVRGEVPLKVRCFNAVSHCYDGFTSLCSHPLLPNRRRSVGMLQRVSEKATDAVLPVGSYWGVVTWWCRLRSEGKCTVVYVVCSKCEQKLPCAFLVKFSY